MFIHKRNFFKFNKDHKIGILLTMVEKWKVAFKNYQ